MSRKRSSVVPVFFMAGTVGRVPSRGNRRREVRRLMEGVMEEVPADGAVRERVPQLHGPELAPPSVAPPTVAPPTGFEPVLSP
jgi:hypothetical protein